MSKLKSLMVSAKSTLVDFPGFPGFQVELNFLSREELIKIRKDATKVSFKNRQPQETLDEDLFMQLYCDSVIKGWKGLKFKYLEQLLLVDTSSISNLDEELVYSKEDAIELMKGSSVFDSFVTDTLSDLANFQKPSSENSQK